MYRICIAVYRMIVLHSAGFYRCYTRARACVCVGRGGACPARAQASKATPEGSAEPNGGVKVEFHPSPTVVFTFWAVILYIRQIFF